jgi:hypothetical protein
MAKRLHREVTEVDRVVEAVARKVAQAEPSLVVWDPSITGAADSEGTIL